MRGRANARVRLPRRRAYRAPDCAREPADARLPSVPAGPFSDPAALCTERKRRPRTPPLSTHILPRFPPGQAPDTNRYNSLRCRNLPPIVRRPRFADDGCGGLPHGFRCAGAPFADAGHRKRRALAMRIRKRRLASGIAMTAVIALASTLAATSVRAGDGAVWGGIAGGLIGSTIGKGNGRLVAIGAGTLLGTLYGQQQAAHRHPPRRHVRPLPPRPRHWHGHRAHRHPPHVHLPPRHRHGHRNGWKRPHVPAPAFVHPHGWRPPHVHIPVAPPRHGWKPPRRHAPAGLHPGRAGPRHGHRQRHAYRDCRILQHGAPPVVACRTARGVWRIRH